MFSATKEIESPVRSSMLSTRKNATRLVPVFLVIAIVLTNPDCLPFDAAQANSNRSSQLLKTEHKVLRLLKGSEHNPDESVTVLVTLGTTRSAGLIAFFN
jgi:hypothetical protein